jgi:hypothetical protein
MSNGGDEYDKVLNIARHLKDKPWNPPSDWAAKKKILRSGGELPRDVKKGSIDSTGKQKSNEQKAREAGINQHKTIYGKAPGGRKRRVASNTTPRDVKPGSTDSTGKLRSLGVRDVKYTNQAKGKMIGGGKKRGLRRKK